MYTLNFKNKHCNKMFPVPSLSTLSSLWLALSLNTMALVMLRCIKEWDHVELMRAWSVMGGVLWITLQIAPISTASQLTKFEHKGLSCGVIQTSRKCIICSSFEDLTIQEECTHRHTKRTQVNKDTPVYA